MKVMKKSYRKQGDESPRKFSDEGKVSFCFGELNIKAQPKEERKDCIKFTIDQQPCEASCHHINNAVGILPCIFFGHCSRIILLDHRCYNDSEQGKSPKCINYSNA